MCGARRFIRDKLPDDGKNGVSGILEGLLLAEGLRSFGESERCLVDHSGYWRPKAQRIGNSILSEPQDDPALSLDSATQRGIDLARYLFRAGATKQVCDAVQRQFCELRTTRGMFRSLVVSAQSA